MPKVFVAGLDGANPFLIRRWIDEGHLPEMKRISEEGAFGILRSTMPPISPAAWTTFLTGMTPGNHGVFDFFRYQPEVYLSWLKWDFVTSDEFQGWTFLDALSEAGQRVAAVTIPVTYPPWNINGKMVSGYPCPDTSVNYTSPAEFSGALREPLNFSADYFNDASQEEIFRSGLEMTQRRTRVGLDLIRDGYDCIVVVLGEIDRAQHNFWAAFDETYPIHGAVTNETLRGAILEQYRECDRSLGEFRRALSPDTLFMVVSDHGSGPRPTRQFHTNAWLARQGYLRAAGQGPSLVDRGRRVSRFLKSHEPFASVIRKVPRGLKEGASSVRDRVLKSEIHWPETHAFRFPMHAPAEGIVLNVAGRQPEGCVAEGDSYEALRDTLIAELREVVCPETGRRVVEDVLKREEIYEGRYTERMPDLVALLSPDYEGGTHTSGSLVTRVPEGKLARVSGIHKLEGTFMACGPGVVAGSKPDGAGLEDIAPTVLAVLECAIPDWVEGRVLGEILDPDFRESHAPRVGAGGRRGQQTRTELTAEEKDQIRQKLEGLGYL
jgi:predicted AlkP superfamily phosphohydrolase/phosphomutase